MPFSHIVEKNLNQASHFTAITTNIRSINSQPVKVKVNVGIGEGRCEVTQILTLIDAVIQQRWKILPCHLSCHGATVT